MSPEVKEVMSSLREEMKAAGIRLDDLFEYIAHFCSSNPGAAHSLCLHARDTLVEARDAGAEVAPHDLLADALERTFVSEQHTEKYGSMGIVEERDILDFLNEVRLGVQAIIASEDAGQLFMAASAGGVAH